MKLALTEDQELIRDAAESFLADVSDSAAVRRAMETPLGYEVSVWERLAGELGWCGIAIDEAHGGLGLGALELALVQEQAGRHLLCAPFFSTVCVGATLLQVLASADACAQRLPRIAEGALRLGVPLPEGDGDWSRSGRLRARPAQAEWIVDGRCARMLDAGGADELLTFAELPEGGVGLFAVPRTSDGVSISPLATWDQTRRLSEVGFSKARAQRLDDPARAHAASAALQEALARVRVYLAAEQLGSAQQCLDLTLAYVGGRRQFGRSIAGFQAVKHRCASMMVRIEALRSAVHGVAVQAATAGRAPMLECAMLRAEAADTLFWCAQEAIQLHGGVGFTWEYDPQLYFKRAQAQSHWFGTADGARERIARALLDDGGRAAAGHDAGTQAQSGAAAETDADAQDAAFRAEVAQWMHAHLSGRFEALRHRGGPGDEEAYPELRKEWERELASGGWTCVGWPREAGGRGLSIAQQVIFHEEYARAGGPGRMGHIGEGLIGPALIRFGTPQQQRRFLPRIVDGSEYWAQGYSEPNAGSDLANVQTRCWQEADGSWRVQGQKIWTSLAHESDWIFVLARCEPGSRGNKGLAFLLLPLTQDGIEIRPIRQLGGGSEFNEVFFDGARAEADHIVGAPGEGWMVAMGLLEAERGVSTLGQQMHFAHELDLVIDVARRNGRARDPAIRARIATAWCGLRTMRHNALRMLSGDQTRLSREALIGKYYWSNWHRDLGKLAMDVLGAQGDVVTEDATVRRLQQLFFFSRADTIYAGTNEIQLNIIAERGLGMPREPRPAG